MGRRRLRREELSMTTNPFTPNFGQIPRVLAGRDLLLVEMDGAFDNAPGDPNLTSILVGARGTGKTALMTQLASNAQAKGWIAVNVPCVSGMLEEIAQGTARKAAHVLAPTEDSHVTGLSIGQIVSVEWERDAHSQPTWYSRMTAMLDQLSAQDTGLLITVDEVRPSLEEMIQLASYYQLFVREEQKVALLMAGLPGEVSSLLNSESVSFLRRASQHHLGKLSDEDIGLALQETAQSAGKRFDEESLNAAVNASEGFPFMMQLVGFRAWQAAAGSKHIEREHVQQGIQRAALDMKTRVLDATLNELSPGDFGFLRAMLPDAGESLTSEIASRMKQSESYASQYRKRLIERGVIESARRGSVRFALPLLKDYLPEYLDIA